jgi:hypothetical protein
MSLALRAVSALMVLVALVHARGLTLGFAWDDHRIIEHSERMRSLSTAVEVFIRPSYWVIGPVAETPVTTYRPLALATMAVDYAVWGGAPVGFHATNLALHLACVGVLLWMLRRWGIPLGAAWLGAAIFGLHPCGAEAVTWINGRSEPLCLLFGMAAVGLSVRTGGAQSARRLIALAACLTLSLLGKETGIIFAPLSALTLWRTGEPGASKPWPGLAAVLAGVAVYGAMRGVALRGAPPSEELALASAVLAWPMVWLRTLQVTFLPHRLGMENLLAWLQTTTTVDRVAAWGLFAGVSLGAPVLLWRGRTLDAIGLGWALAAMGPPSLTLATGGYWPGLNRWVYVALPGLLLPLCRVLGPRMTRRAAIPAAFALLGLGLELQPAIAVWASDEALLLDMAARHPTNEYAYLLLARQRLARGDGGGALAVLAVGRRAAVQPEKLVCLEARTHARLGRCDDAAVGFSSGDCRAISGMRPAEELARCRARGVPVR